MRELWAALLLLFACGGATDHSQVAQGGTQTLAQGGTQTLAQGGTGPGPIEVHTGGIGGTGGAAPFGGFAGLGAAGGGDTCPIRVVEGELPMVVDGGSAQGTLDGEPITLIAVPGAVDGEIYATLSTCGDAAVSYFYLRLDLEKAGGGPLGTLVVTTRLDPASCSPVAIYLNGDDSLALESAIDLRLFDPHVALGPIVMGSLRVRGTDPAGIPIELAVAILIRATHHYCP